MQRQNALLLVVASASLLLGVAGYHLFMVNQPDQPATTVPETLAAIPLTHLDGSQSLIGDRTEDYLIVNFWAPWCAPCRREIPALVDIHEQLSGQGISVLGIAYDGKQAVEDFAAEYDINFPMFLAGAQIAMYNAAFGNPVGGLPFTAILDRKRQRVFHHSGEITREALLKALTAAGADTSRSS